MDDPKFTELIERIAKLEERTNSLEWKIEEKTNNLLNMFKNLECVVRKVDTRTWAILVTVILGILLQIWLRSI